MERLRRTAHLTVRLTDEERQTFDALALRLGRTPSDALRFVGLWIAEQVGVKAPQGDNRECSNDIKQPAV
jgi:hypothetical protein